MDDARIRPPELLAAVGLAAFVTGCTIWHETRGAVIVSNLGQCLAPFLAAAACRAAARRSDGRDMRRAWWFLSASSAAWGLGQVFWTYYEISGAAAPFPSLADLGYLAAVPLALVGVWSLSARSATRAVAMLDGLIIATALLGVSWPLVLGPSWEAGEGSLFELCLTLAYPIGNLAVATSVLTVLMRRPGRTRNEPFAYVASGLLVLALADSIFVVNTLAGTEQNISVADFGWVAGYLLIACGALRHPVATAAAEREAPSLRRALLPIATVTLTLGVRLGLVAAEEPGDAALTGITVVLAVLVLVRHLVTMRENQVLTGELEHKIGQLTSREEELSRRAFHDPLTGLANRQLFGDRVDHALRRAERSGETIAVLFVDLDDFKTVNDSLGHAAGDQLLVRVGERLQGCLRPGDTVARLGGDEFGILLEEVDHAERPAAVAHRIMEELEVPITLGDREVFARASVGVATATGDVALGGADLLGDADVALYAAKSQGKSTFRTFELAMRDAALERLELGQDLRRAITHDQFVCRYQPIVDLVTGAAVAVEALVRWNHPTRGLLEPASFVSMAEETGVIGQIGLHVLEVACRQAVEWRETGAVPPSLVLHVNLSVRQLSDADLVDEVRRILATTGMAPASLVLEITETVVVDVGARHLDRLLALRDLGIRLAIDDFGAGYSSLGYLRALPVDVLKIDRGFAATSRDASDPVLLEAIVKLGRSLGIETIAEGIESEEQAATLRRLGCRRAQGFLFSVPVAPSEVPAVVAHSRTRPVPAQRT